MTILSWFRQVFVEPSYYDDDDEGLRRKLEVLMMRLDQSRQDFYAAKDDLDEIRAENSHIMDSRRNRLWDDEWRTVWHECHDAAHATRHANETVAAWEKETAK